MTVNRYLRIVAGLMILVTLGLGHWVHEEDAGDRP